MLISQETADFVEKVQEIDSLEELEAYVIEIVTKMGVGHVFLAQVGGAVPESEIMSGNYPIEWVSHYAKNNYVYYDPANIWMLSGNGPIDWSDLQSAGLLKGKAKQVFGECGEFGLKEGISFPIFRSDGSLAIVNFAGSHFETNPEVKPALHLIAIYYHARAKELLPAINDNAENPTLTGRERECLHWAASGKTDWEIGEILCISEVTAHKHIENAKRKFGVPTRVQAVVESIRHSLIRI